MFRLRLAVLCVCFGSLATRNHTSTVIISRVTGNATDNILTAPSARHEDGNAAVSGDVQERVRLRSTGEPVDGSEAVPVVIRHRSSVTGEYKNETQRENIQSTNSMNTTEALSIARSSVTGEYKNETQRENIQNTNSTNTTEAVSVARMDGSSVTREYKNETHRENIQNTNSTNTTEDVSGARIHGSSVTEEYKNETQRANIQNTNSTNTTEDVSGARIDSRRNMLPAFSVYPKAVSFQTNPPTRIAPSTELVSPRIVDDFFLPYMGASSGSTKGNWVLAQKAPAQDIHWSTVRSWMSWAPESLHAWCNSYYKNRFSTVGSTYPVCGYRIDQTTLTYQFKTFDDWCKMEEENFQARSYRYAWTILHTGKCNMEQKWYRHWSSQDGYWSSQSLYELVSQASFNDYEMKKIYEGEYARRASVLEEYDYICQNYFPWFNSKYILQTRACYWVSNYKENFESARKKCESMDSRLIVFENAFEFELIVKYVKSVIDKNDYILFGYKKKNNKFREYYTDRTEDDIKYTLKRHPESERWTRWLGAERDAYCMVGVLYHNLEAISAGCEQYYFYFICKRILYASN